MAQGHSVLNVVVIWSTLQETVYFGWERMTPSRKVTTLLHDLFFKAAHPT